LFGYAHREVGSFKRKETWLGDRHLSRQQERLQNDSLFPFITQKSFGFLNIFAFQGGSPLRSHGRNVTEDADDAFRLEKSEVTLFLEISSFLPCQLSDSFPFR
ncbi:hypothetical protein BaRGS_00000349, partial [Batillaria attramentaria]